MQVGNNNIWITPLQILPPSNPQLVIQANVRVGQNEWFALVATRMYLEASGLMVGTAPVIKRNFHIFQPGHL